MASEPPIEPNAAQPPTGSLDASNEDHGRIGYGRYARYTPFALAAVIVAVLLVIAIVQHDNGGSGTGIGQLIGQQAPDFSLSTFDGQTVHLTDYQGSVVVLNFWAEWCEPCKQEMPAFQTLSTSAAANGQKLAIVGVNIKNDTVASAQAFAKSLGITYPLGHDVSPGTTIRGLIESSYGMGGQYPATVFIRPNGVIDSVHFGAMTTDQMQASIAAARKS
jgi:peroxiredoxin